MSEICIPNPCYENWNKMNPEEKGRFCSVCSKCVIDFTEKNSQEIQEIIEEKSKESVCGRFYNYQLSINESKSVKIKDKFFRYIPLGFQSSGISLGLLSLILFLTGCSKTKENCVATTGLVVIEEDTLPKKDDYTIGKIAVPDDSMASISKEIDSINFNKTKNPKK